MWRQRHPGFESLALRFTTTQVGAIFGPDLGSVISGAERRSRQTPVAAQSQARKWSSRNDGDAHSNRVNKPRENHTENTHPTASTEWLTVMQVCDRAHIGRTYLYDAWATGTGPRYSQVGGKRLIKDTWLNDWLLAHEVTD